MLKAIGKLIRSHAQNAWVRAQSKRVDPRQLAKSIDSDVRFGLVLPIEDPSMSRLERVVRSLHGQLFPNWQLCIVPYGGSNNDFSEYANATYRDERTSLLHPDIHRPKKIESRCEAIQRAVESLTTDFLGVIDDSIQLEDDCLIWAAHGIACHPQVEWLYFDHLEIEDAESFDRPSANELVVDRYCPVFKPDFSRELLLSGMFTGPLNFYRRSLFRQLNGFSIEAQPAEDFDFALRASERLSSEQIHRVAEIGYVCRKPHPPDAVADTRVIEQAFHRRGHSVEVKNSVADRVYLPRFIAKHQQEVVVLVPTRNQKQRVQKCVSSVRETTNYPNYRIVLIDNQSDDPELFDFYKQETGRGDFSVHAFDEPFNYARMHNQVIRDLESDFVLLLNNDVYDFSEGWLEQLVATANMSDDIGCVGCLLKFPDGMTQHGGVSFGIGKPCRHAHLGVNANDAGYCGRLQSMQQLSALTAALLLIRTKVFNQLGGFDEQLFPISYNDTDLCLKMDAQGYRCIYNPAVHAVHEESVSRGKSPMEKKWRREFENKWGASITSDRFYNPHLSRKAYEPDVHRLRFYREHKRVSLANAVRAA